jgi:broad specificity phosphatase PhoE
VHAEFDVVFLARHGETEWNRLGRRQGQLDSPLSAEGARQARRVAAVAARSQVDGIFSSPLGRALATAEQSAEALALPVVVIDELIEVDHGAMSGLTSAEIEQAFPGALRRRAARKFEWCFPGGESYADADRRAVVALRQIATSGAKRPLVVSHEMTGRMLLRRLLALDPATALVLRLPHDVVLQVDPGSQGFVEIRVDSLYEGDAGPS